jgi:hypothetical protein
MFLTNKCILTGASHDLPQSLKRAAIVILYIWRLPGYNLRIVTDHYDRSIRSTLIVSAAVPG